ncbi:hypothetical protein ACRCJP_04650 [Aerococcus urinaeequi]|uniref:hypothetical protein n=1 Tax=Aerococcus urinaeequi TaxID=51665 RepID=UPI003AB01581
MGGLRHSYEYIYGVAKPDEPGEVLGYFAVALVFYLILKILQYFKGEDELRKEEWSFITDFARIWKVVVITVASIMAIQDVLDPSEMSKELQICIVVVVLFEVIDEWYDLIVEIRDKN